MTKEEVLEAVKGMSVLDLAELVKMLEEEFGVSAAVPMALASGPAAGTATLDKIAGQAGAFCPGR